MGMHVLCPTLLLILGLCLLNFSQKNKKNIFFLMTLAGWITMILSVSTVITLLACCLWRILHTPEKDPHLHTLHDHTPDEKQ